VARVRAAAKVGDDVDVVHVPELEELRRLAVRSMFDAQVKLGGEAGGAACRARAVWSLSAKQCRCCTTR
jgi:hypothetical protein